MSLEHVLLGLLRRPASGYDLKKEFEASVGQYWRAPLSQVYPTLHRLEGRGLLRSHEEPSARGPARRVYERTLDGWEELREWLESGPVRGPERTAFLAQLAFLEELGDAATTLEFLEELRTRWRMELERVRSLRGERGLHEDLALGLRARLFETRLRWSEDAIARVRNA